MIAIDLSGGYPFGWLALVGPATMYWVLRYATGVPHLETHMERTRGAAFEEYQAPHQSVLSRTAQTTEAEETRRQPSAMCRTRLENRRMRRRVPGVLDGVGTYATPEVFKIFSNSLSSVSLPAAMWPVANIASLPSQSVT